jgi:hypothetical protein
VLVAWLTLAAVAIFVLLLAGCLLAIAWMLTSARRNVILLADTLERTAHETAGLAERIAKADRGAVELAAEVRSATEALTRVVGQWGRRLPG